MRCIRSGRVPRRQSANQYQFSRVKSVLNRVVMVLTALIVVACTTVKPEASFSRAVQPAASSVTASNPTTREVEVVNVKGVTLSSETRERLSSQLLRSLVDDNVIGADPSVPFRLKATVTRDWYTRGLLGGKRMRYFDVQYLLYNASGQRVFQHRVSSKARPDNAPAAVIDNANRFAEAASTFFRANSPMALTTGSSAIQQFNPSSASAGNALAPTLAATPVARQESAKVVGTHASKADRVAALPPTITSMPAGGTDFGTYHALIIGNNAYSQLKPLRSAVADAKRVDAILREHYGFKTRVLLNAKRAGILLALAEMRRQLTPRDNLLIYYAGHGTQDVQADEGYWLPVDAQRDNPSQWISNASVVAEIRATRAKHVLVVADSCFSGKLTRGLKPRIVTDGYLDRMASRIARTALTSGGLEPVLDGGGRAGHSVFSTAFVDALLVNTGVTDAAQLVGFIRHRVYLESDQLPEYGDIRRAGHAGGDFLFVRQSRQSKR